MRTGRMVAQATREFQSTPSAGDSGASITITLADAQYQTVTLTADSVALTIDASGVSDGTYSLTCIQDTSGGRAITSATCSSHTVYVEGGVDLAFTADPSARDTLVMRKEGTALYLKIAGEDWQEWV